MIFLEGSYDGIVTFIAIIMFGPAILFSLIGGVLLYKKKNKPAKVFFILAVLYLIVSLGTCGFLVS